jgi:hypothetical protein
MTLLSCLGIGIAFAVAVLLLLFAGVLIGWAIPIRKGPKPPPRGP